MAAENESHEGKRKVESQWPVFKLHHQRSRYIYDLYYKRRGISKELYDFCIKEGYADANLIAKWKKVRHFLVSLFVIGFFKKKTNLLVAQPGFDNLCCLRCTQTRDTNFATTCICRVPKSKRDEGKPFECAHCGCRGCAG